LKWLLDFCKISAPLYQRDQINEDELGGAVERMARGGEEKCIENFGGEAWRKDVTWKT
jgi:hypothetical protein